VPCGTLDIPADVLARSHGRSADAGRAGGSRPAREGREPRENRDAREPREGPERVRSGRPYGSRQPVDEFFLKPYVPSNSPALDAPVPLASSGASDGKRKIAVLLGGGKKAD
jgi:hypothetical protein